MRSFTQEIEEKAKQTRKDWREFIKDNHDSYKRYLALFGIIDAEKKQAVEAAKQDKATLLSLTSQLNGEDVVYDNILEQIKRSEARLNTSRNTLTQLQSEFDRLQEKIAPEEKKYEEALAEIQTKKIVITCCSLWKTKPRPHSFFEAIDRNNLSALQRLYRPILANYIHENGYTPLIYAITKGRIDMIRWLLLKKSVDNRSYDVNPDLPVSFGGYKNITPMSAAIIWENSEAKFGQDTVATEIMAALLAMGANINKFDRTKKFTSLHWASFTGSKACIQFLLEKGADSTIEDIEFKKPLQIFKLFHKHKPYYKEIEKLFMAHPKRTIATFSRKWF